MSDKSEVKNDKVLALINEAKMAEWELKFIEPRKVNKKQPDAGLPQRSTPQSDKRMDYFC